jgi:hypothetical protein
MSLIKKADVKNPLSARHRSEIHLARPASKPEATGIDPKVNDSAENSLDIPVPTKPEAAPIVTSKSVKA